MRGEHSVMIGATIIGILACSANAAANPRADVSYGYASTGDAIFTIFVFNIWTNLFWFSALLLLTCLVWKKGLDNVPKTSLVFIAGVAAVAVLVTVLGAIIDYTLLLREYPFGFALYYNLLNWCVAVVLIFISVYASAMLVLRVSAKASVLPAAVMAALNPVWWGITLNAEPMVGVLTIAVSLVAIPVFLLGLFIWHHRRFRQKDPTEPRAAAEPGSG